MSRSVDLDVDSYIHSLVSQDDKSFMMPYQSFIVKYFNSPAFTSKTLLLLFMEVGTGKTLTSLVCGIEGLRSKQFKRVIVLSPKSVQDEFEKNLRMYYNLSGGRDIHLIRNKIMMIPYNANNSYQQLVKVGDLEDTLFIIDEAHLFMKSIIKVSVMDATTANKKVKSNRMRGSGHEGLSYSDEDEDETVETYVSSGWLDVPVADWMVKYIDDMEESMRGGYVGSDMDENDDVSVDADADISDLDDIPSSSNHSDCPSCSSLYLTATATSTTPSHTHVTNIGNAKLIYDLIRSLKRKKVICLTGTPSSKHPFETVPMFNLAGCNFPTTFDTFTARYIDTDRYTLINRSELLRKITGLVAYVRADTASQHLRSTPLNTVNVEMSEPQYRQYLIDYEKELAERGFSNKRNIFGLMFGAKSSFHAKTFEDSIYWNSSLSNADGDTNRYVGSIVIDKEHCPKIIKMYDDAEAIHGTCVFYFRFVRMYGVETMMHKLKMEGYRLPKPGEDVFDMAPTKRFVLFTGSVAYETRMRWKAMFNDPRNRYGEYIKYLILSPSGSVGVTLKNVRYLGIGSVEFNYSMIRQIMGRVNRLNSHVDLPERDRTLVNNIYLATKNETYYRKHRKEIDALCSREAPGYKEKASCIERIIYQDSLLDDKVNEAFRGCLIEASVWKRK